MEQEQIEKEMLARQEKNKMKMMEVKRKFLHPLLGISMLKGGKNSVTWFTQL